MKSLLKLAYIAIGCCLGGCVSDDRSSLVDEKFPLAAAIAHGKKAEFQNLLERGENPNLQAQVGYPVMILCAMHEDPDYLRIAIKHHGDANFVDADSHRTPMSAAILTLRRQNIRTLVDAHADLDHQDATRSTPMMRAAALNRYDFVYDLLEAGADPTLENN
jgi:ankyrin repeat protein